MSEGDYPALAKLEKAFQEKNLPHFTSLLSSSRDLPLLLRVHAVCMLEHIGDESVVPTLCRVLSDDPSPLTRHEAAFTLGQLGYRSAVPALINAMLSDESPIVRHESAVALSSIGDDAALPQLEKAIGDNDEDVSNSALIAFEYLSYLKRKKETSPTEDTSTPKIRL
jgi:deoxyhypusine monooxygenase